MKQLKLEDLLNPFERSITVRDVAESLETRKPSEDAVSVRAYMDEKIFDVIAIEENGSISGYVERESLKTGICKDYTHKFDPSDLISESTPLIYLLSILQEKPRVFVLYRNHVTGIVTHADLQKAPVRMLLFGLVTFLEMFLLRLIRQHCKETWQNQLKPPRLQDAKNLLSQRRQQKEDIDLLDCTQFCDKRDIVVTSPEILRKIGYENKGKEVESLLRDAETLRNQLAHAQEDIKAAMTWTEVLELAAKIQNILEYCEEHAL